MTARYVKTWRIFNHWWWQKGLLLTCGANWASVWCVADNLSHYEYRWQLMFYRRTGCFRPKNRHDRWVARKHDRAVEYFYSRGDTGHV